GRRGYDGAVQTEARGEGSLTLPADDGDSIGLTRAVAGQYRVHVPVRDGGGVPRGPDAGEDRSDPGLQRHYRKQAMAAAPDRCAAYRPAEHRRDSDHQVGLAAAA